MRYSVRLWIDVKKLATSRRSAHAGRRPFAVTRRSIAIRRSLPASVPLPFRQANESWMKPGSKVGSSRDTSRWWTMRSRKSAANTSRGLGPSVTKQIDVPGRQVCSRSSRCKPSRFASASASKASALRVTRSLRRQLRYCRQSSRNE